MLAIGTGRQLQLVAESDLNNQLTFTPAGVVSQLGWTALMEED